MKKFSAEMKVVRFGAEDMIVTSGNTMILSNFNDGIAANGIVNFGGRNYTIDNEGSIESLLDALDNSGMGGSISIVGGLLETFLRTEFESGMNGDWDTTYVYNPTSNNFDRQ